jgi:hypothetical protein
MTISVGFSINAFFAGFFTVITTPPLLLFSCEMPDGTNGSYTSSS